MNIYCMNGVALSGKDTFVDYVLADDKVRGVKLSTVDAVKLIAMDRFGWDGVKDEKGRMLLATLRSAWGAYNDGPISDVVFSISRAMVGGCIVVFIMVREFPEMMKLVDLLGAHTILVERPDSVICPTEQMFLDMVPKDYLYDIHLFNGQGLDEWSQLAKRFVREELML